MAKIKETTYRAREEVKVSRPGIHSKTKVSKLKSSKNYRKAYRGQGK